MRLTLALALALLVGCVRTNLPHSAPGGAGPAPDTVLVVGSLRVVPKVNQQEASGPHAILLGGMHGNFLASFTRTLQEPFRHHAWPPVEGADTAWVPMEGRFYVQVPAGKPLYLRGLSAVTNVGRTDLELPLRIDLRPGDRVVYIGHLHFIRTSPQKVLVKDRRALQEQDARMSGRGALLKHKWVTRLARPADAAPGDQEQEHRDITAGRDPAWAPLALR